MTISRNILVSVTQLFIRKCLQKPATKYSHPIPAFTFISVVCRASSLYVFQRKFCLYFLRTLATPPSYTFWVNYTNCFKLKDTKIGVFWFVTPCSLGGTLILEELTSLYSVPWRWWEFAFVAVVEFPLYFLCHMSGDGDPYSFHQENTKCAKWNDSLCLLIGEMGGKHWSGKMKWVSFLYVCKLEQLKRSDLYYELLLTAMEVKCSYSHCMYNNLFWNVFY
jgi:hypothetical protein